MLQVCQYLMWRKSRPENKISAEVDEKVENAIQVWMIRQYQLINTKRQPIIGRYFYPCCEQELFWKLVKLRVKPDNERITVLIHGGASLDNIMFSYDELSGRPNQVGTRGHTSPVELQMNRREVLLSQRTHSQG